MKKRKKRRKIHIPLCQVTVNGIRLPPNMHPNDLFTSIFSCMCKPGIELWSLESLHKFYCFLLKTVAEVCDHDWSHTKASEKARRTNYINKSIEKRVHVTKIYRYLYEDEKRCKMYLLTTIYNEVLKGMKD